MYRHGESETSEHASGDREIRNAGSQAGYDEPEGDHVADDHESKPAHGLVAVTKILAHARAPAPRGTDVSINTPTCPFVD
jgi:hypothetical protein